MAVAFRAAGTWSFTANNVSTPFTCTPGAPTGKAVGDLLVLICESRSITATVATPTGWTLHPDFPKRSTTASGGTFYVFLRIADGTATDTPSPVWSGLTTGTTGDSAGAGILAYSGGSTTPDGGTTVISDLSAQTTSSTLPSLTTSVSNSLVISLAMKIIDASGTSTVTTFTKRAGNVTTSGTGHDIQVNDVIKTTAGATGTGTETWGLSTSARVLAVAFALQQKQPIITPSNVAATSTMGGAVTAKKAIKPTTNISATSKVSCGQPAAPAFVQEIIAHNNPTLGGATTTSFTLAATPTLGNTLILSAICDGHFSGTIVTDSKGNTWTVDNNQSNVFNMIHASCHMDVAPLVAGDTITLHAPVLAMSTCSCYVEEFSGILTASSPVDDGTGFATHASGSNVRVTGTVTPTKDFDLIFASCALTAHTESGFTIGGGGTDFPTNFVNDSTSNSAIMGGYLVNGSGTAGTGVTLNGTGIILISASFGMSTAYFAANAPGIVIIPAGGGSKSITPSSNIAATSSMSGAVQRLRPIVPATISATSTVSGSLRVTRAIKPTTNISATSTVSGRVNKLARIGGNVAATSTVSGRVNKLAAISGAIAATSTVSGRVNRLAAISGAIAATSTMSGLVQKLRPITPTASILATCTIFALGRPIIVIRAVKPSIISATSTVSGNVSVLRRIAPSTISATSTVSGRVNKLAAIAGVISATSTVSGRVNKLAAISGAIAATSTVTGAVQRRRPIVPTTSISATSTVSGRVNKLARIGGNVAATSIMSGNVSVLRRISGSNIAATSTVSGRINKLAAIAGAIAATSTVTGALRVTRAIKPTTNISATSTVSGNATAIHKISGAVAATSTVSGNINRIPAGKFITPTTNVAATSTVAGSVSTRKAVSGAISAVSTVSGRVTALRAVLGAVSATSTMTGRVTVLRKIAGSVAATSTVAGSITVRRAIKPTTNISATATMTGIVTRLGTDPIIPTTSISATSTVTGRITVRRKIAGSISATSTVAGQVRVIRAAKPSTISATSTMTGTVTRLRHFTGSIFASSTVTGSIRVRRAVRGNIVAQSAMSGILQMQRGILPSIISSTSTVSGAVVIFTRPTGVRGFTPRILGTVQDIPTVERVRT